MKAGKPAKTLHWGGYVDTPKSGGASAFRDSQATFTIPTVNCTTTPNSEVYHFAGIGGWPGDGTTGFAAAGIVEGCSSGSPYYYGSEWYYDCYYNCSENGPDQILSVSPGDTVSASVYWNDNTGDLIITLVDHTSGQYDQQTLNDLEVYSYGSAEVVSYGNLNSQGTADFSNVKFSAAEVIPSSGGGRKPLSDPKLWTTIEVLQNGQVTHTADIQPGPLTSTSKSSSFTNTWKGEN